MSNVEYGIIGEPGSYTRSTSNYEMGWKFQLNEDVYFYGFRVKAPSAATKVCRLWNASNVEIAQATLTTVADQWTEVKLNSPIKMLAGETYTISTWTDANYYYNSKSSFTFNPKLTYVHGKAGSSKGSYPNSYTESYVYPLIDAIFVKGVTGKALVEENGSFYTIEDGELVLLQNVSQLTAAVFEQYGVEDVVDVSCIKDLVNPKVHVWNADEQPSFYASEIATPPMQTLYSPEYHMTHSTIHGIEKVTAVASEGVAFAVSADSGETWKMWLNDAWVTLQQEASGMSATVLNGITTTAWNDLIQSNKFKFRISLASADDYFESLEVDYIN